MGLAAGQLPDEFMWMDNRMRNGRVVKNDKHN